MTQPYVIADKAKVKRMSKYWNKTKHKKCQICTMILYGGEKGVCCNCKKRLR